MIVAVDKDLLSKSSGCLKITVAPSSDEKEKTKAVQAGLELVEVSGDVSGKLFLATGKMNDAVRTMLGSLGILAIASSTRKLSSGTSGSFTVKKLESENRFTVYVFNDNVFSMAYAKKLFNNLPNKFASNELLVSVCEFALKSM